MILKLRIHEHGSSVDSFSSTFNSCIKKVVFFYKGFGIFWFFFKEELSTEGIIYVVFLKLHISYFVDIRPQFLYYDILFIKLTKLINSSALVEDFASSIDSYVCNLCIQKIFF